MPETPAAHGPRHPVLGRLAFRATLPVLRFVARRFGIHAADDAFARERLASLKEKLERGETAYLLGVGAGGHNSAVALLEVSRDVGIRLLGNHEEERFRQIKHYQRYPSQAVGQARLQMQRLGIGPERIHAVLLSWDYPAFAANALASVAQELPAGLRLLRPGASPAINIGSIAGAFRAPGRLGKRLGPRGGRLPVIGLRHHDNHAWFSWGVSPFAAGGGRTLVLVIDGTGDDASISAYLAEHGALRRIYSNEGFWDSLGLTYGMLSSTQGGWPIMHSEGRFMGAAAWGDGSRETNPYYQRLREILVLAPEGRVYLNRRLANWHRGGVLKPYTQALTEILGEPIAPERMWNPDAVLRVEEIEHAPITQDRVNKAAAVQLVFEDAMLHILEHLLRATGTAELVLTGGTALNCVANMRVLEHFDEAWYEQHAPGAGSRRLHLWVPPVPNDEGVAAGAAYAFACAAGARPRAPLEHAFYCGLPPSRTDIEAALAEVPEIGFEQLGEAASAAGREAVADLLARIVADDGVIGLFQGAGETGPRALGHRSILANPANPRTLETLNHLVKFREKIRPLAPMATLEAAQRFFELSPGAADADYNAYNYMILTARARPEARRVIPAVIHHDGTGRVQIVREKVDPICHAYLRAMGRRIGAEVSVNTSLNVGAPIAQSPRHALETLRKTRAMDGLFLVAEDGSTWVAWHAVDTPPKDAGRRLRQWIQQWRGAPVQCAADSSEPLQTRAGESVA